MTPTPISKDSYEYYLWAAAKVLAPGYLTPTTPGYEMDRKAGQCLAAASALVHAWQHLCDVTLPVSHRAAQEEAPPVEAIKLGASAETLPEVKAALLKEKIRQEEELHNLFTEEALNELEREHRLK